HKVLFITSEPPFESRRASCCRCRAELIFHGATRSVSNGTAEMRLVRFGRPPGLVRRAARARTGIRVTRTAVPRQVQVYVAHVRTHEDGHHDFAPRSTVGRGGAP